ncbi:MAG: deoxyribodipyrimidine photo-lyase [Gammaproteobacteria bacterium]|nr:deoxyribodipyrimidine photo-lyase [Gammaproteobacteria bacterium]
MKTILWLREDLRLYDNLALNQAAADGEVIPVFFYPEHLGGASYWWLHHSLSRLAEQFAEHGVTLILRTGDPARVVLKLCEEIGSTKVVFNRVYSSRGMAQGQAVKQALQGADIECQSFNSQLLFEPGKIFNKQGTPFKVFTPFWKHCCAQLQPPAPQAFTTLKPVGDQPDSEQLSDWGLLPTRPNWAQGLADTWQPGEAGAQQRWQEFLNDRIQGYKEGRDFPEREQTSLLSPHLTFGEISPRQLWHDTQEAMASGLVDASNGNKFLAEIGWREFSRYLLVHFPQIETEAFNQKFADFPWKNSAKLLKAWQKGETGYPIVDAGMRELWHTGYMHNRVRMIVASFLTKHCLVHWQSGMDWFWDTLVDADVANNTASWQWVAGCGADAAPYFRIFNPILQGEKHDKLGVYVRRWVPELKKMPNKTIHQPWTADEETLAEAGVKLGKDYPRPIVDHADARAEALAAYQAIKSSS